MSARERLERICGPQTPPELITELDNYRVEAFTEGARLLEDAACDADWTQRGRLVSITTERAGAATAPAAGLNGRLADLYAAIHRQRGRWNATRTVRLYRRLDSTAGLPDTKVRAVARGDLRDLAAWGFLTLHDEPSNRHYTLRTKP